MPAGVRLFSCLRVVCILPPCEAPMPFSIRPFRSFPVHCYVTYNAEPFQGQGSIWNLSCTGWRISGDLPMRPGETLSLKVTLPNDQRIDVPLAAVHWLRGGGRSLRLRI